MAQSIKTLAVAERLVVSHSLSIPGCQGRVKARMSPCQGGHFSTFLPEILKVFPLMWILILLNNPYGNNSFYLTHRLIIILCFMLNQNGKFTSSISEKLTFFILSVLYMHSYIHVYFNLFAFQDIMFVHVKPVKDDLFTIMSWSVFDLCLKRQQIVKQYLSSKGNIYCSHVDQIKTYIPGNAITDE